MKSHWYGASSKSDERPFWTVFSGFALDAFDMQIYAFVLPVFLAAWGLSHAQAGLLATAALVSSAFGGWLAGMLADRFGRVRVLKWTIFWFAIATCLCGLTSNFDQLLVARILQGIGFGGEVAVGAVFVGEIAAAQYRGRMVGLAQSGWAIGWALAATASLLVFSLLPAELGWRVMFFFGAFPALLLFFFRSRLSEPQVFACAARPASWRSIFEGPVRRSTIKGSMLATGVHSGYWAIATWWPAMLLAERGLTLTQSGPYLAALIAGSFLGYVAGALLGDRLGRRATLACFALSGMALVLMYSQLAVSSMPFILLSCALGFVATGMYGIIGSTLVELYPTELRGSGLGFCYNFGRGMAGLAPAAIGACAATFGVSNAIALCVVFAYGLVLLAAFWLVETQGQELDSLHQVKS